MWSLSADSLICCLKILNKNSRNTYVHIFPECICQNWPLDRAQVHSFWHYHFLWHLRGTWNRSTAVTTVLLCIINVNTNRYHSQKGTKDKRASNKHFKNKIQYNILLLLYPLSDTWGRPSHKALLKSSVFKRFWNAWRKSACRRTFHEECISHCKRSSISRADAL